MDEESDGLTFVGLDIESTGAGHQYQLIQIGLSLGKGDTFCSDIGWKGGSYILQAKALEVNGFDARRIERGPEPSEVDDLVVRWLARKGLGSKPKRLIPIGWNVGAFDMPFVRATLPRTGELFSRRAIDLNSICFLYGGPSDWQKYKEQAKKEAARIAGDSRWHNAGFDAEAAILAFAYLRSRLVILDTPTAPVVESLASWRLRDGLSEDRRIEKEPTPEEAANVVRG